VKTAAEFRILRHVAVGRGVWRVALDAKRVVGLSAPREGKVVIGIQPAIHAHSGRLDRLLQDKLLEAHVAGWSQPSLLGLLPRPGAKQHYASADSETADKGYPPSYPKHHL